MIKLDAGNVLLKPSHRRQLSALLRRSQRLGRQLGELNLTIRMRRAGRQYQMQARVQSPRGAFDCHCRHNDYQTGLRDLVRCLTARLHGQCIGLQQHGAAAA
jgi:hypothetical protein